MFEARGIQTGFGPGTYLQAADQFILAIVKQAWGDRPIYFAATTNSHSRLGLDPYTARQGVAFKLMTPEELREQVDEDFPELGVALDEMPGVLDRYEARTNIRVGAAPDLRMLQDIPIGVLSWTAPVLGVVLAGVALWAWFARPSAAPAVTTAPSTDPALEEAE